MKTLDEKVDYILKCLEVQGHIAVAEANQIGTIINLLTNIENNTTTIIQKLNKIEERLNNE